MSPVSPVVLMRQIHSPINLVVKPGSPLPLPSWRQDPLVINTGHSIHYYLQIQISPLTGGAVRETEKALA